MAEKPAMSHEFIRSGSYTDEIFSSGGFIKSLFYMQTPTPTFQYIYNFVRPWRQKKYVPLDSIQFKKNISKMNCMCVGSHVRNGFARAIATIIIIIIIIIKIIIAIVIHNIEWYSLWHWSDSSYLWPVYFFSALRSHLRRWLFLEMTCHCFFFSFFFLSWSDSAIQYIDCTARTGVQNMCVQTVQSWKYMYTRVHVGSMHVKTRWNINPNPSTTFNFKHAEQ